MDTEVSPNMSLDAVGVASRLGSGRAARAGSDPSRKLCNNCKQPGHFARDCTNLAVCNNCRLPGHKAVECPSELMCRKCRQPGHFSSACTNEPVCNICGKPGHLALRCPDSGTTTTSTTTSALPSYATTPASPATLPPIVQAASHAAMMVSQDSRPEALHATQYAAPVAGQLVAPALAGHSPGEDSRATPVHSLDASAGVTPASGRSSDRSRKLCNNCKRPGHLARECTNLAVCNNCGQPGHKAAACTNEMMCRNCKQPGHMARECTNEAVCNICGKPGHLALHCADSSITSALPS